MWCKDTNFPTYLPNIPKKKFESKATALSFTAPFDSGCLIWWALGGWWACMDGGFGWDIGLGGMEENKKSGGGDVRGELRESPWE